MRWLLALLMLMSGAAAQADDVRASPPGALSVTVYRAPWRNGGAFDLNNLGGFALITETRVVHLPAGESKLRFEGVVDGIIPESAIVSGLPNGVVEKNRDAAILSPSALMQRALGADVTLVRTNKKTGKQDKIPANIRSADDQGVVFETADGIEALSCAGVPETFNFDRIPEGLSAVPTLSVMTRSSHEITATVTLSYLANGFDWSADYTATLNPDGKTLNLGAWITLANGNGISLPNAQTQIVAGKLNTASEAQFYDPTPQVIARCWPQGHTSDGSIPENIGLVSPYENENRFADVIVTARRVMAPPLMKMAIMAVPVAAPPPPPPEQLGDLKLYRVPQLTTIAARQTKQTRLLEQHGVPYERIYLADLSVAYPQWYHPPYPYDMLLGSYEATQLLRTKNDKAHQLGLPLPAGNIALYQPTGAGAGARNLFAGEVPLRDLAEDEEVDLKFGTSPDVRVRHIILNYNASAQQVTQLTPKLLAIYHTGQAVQQVEITNAKSVPVSFELRLQTYGSLHVMHTDQPMGMKDGRPIFRLTIPANSVVNITYVVGQ